MWKSTICFLIKNGRVILALKRTKVGAGLYNGYGGKLDEGETMRRCAQRETEEECGAIINLEKTELVAVIDFFAGEEPQFSCNIYFAEDWTGDPTESKEMGPPVSFDLESVPYDQMLPGDRMWLERIMKGERFRGILKYSADFSTVVSFETTSAVFSSEE